MSSIKTNLSYKLWENLDGNLRLLFLKNPKDDGTSNVFNVELNIPMPVIDAIKNVCTDDVCELYGVQGAYIRDKKMFVAQICGKQLPEKFKELKCTVYFSRSDKGYRLKDLKYINNVHNAERCVLWDNKTKELTGWVCVDLSKYGDYDAYLESIKQEE